MAKGRISAARAAAFAVPLGCAAGAVQAADIAEMIAKSGGFQTFNELIQAAELTEDMTGEGPFTVFAPTDDAFARLPEDALDALLAEENREALRSLLAMHVVEGEEITPEDVAGSRMSVTTVAGDELTLDGTSQALLLVPTIAGRPDDAADADIAPAAGEPSAPSARDEAQEDTARAVLRAATVIEPDIEADNGVIHAIDAVLVPQSVVTLLEDDAAEASEEQNRRQ